MFNFSSGISGDQSDIDTQQEESMKSAKTGTSAANSATNGTTNTLSNTTNSGSTNTGKTTNTNSGSTNTVSVGPTTSSTYNSGHVDTSQVMLTNDALNYLVKGALESNQGLGSVTTGQKAAGGYDSTATTLMTNDLMSRIAGEVAVRGAQTVNKVGASTSTTYNSAQETTQKIGGSVSVSDVLNNIGASSSSTNSYSNTASNTATNTVANENIVADKEGYTQQDNRSSHEEAKGSFGWIICTELAAQKKLNLKFYLSGLAVFNSYKDEYKKGYYIWGVPVVKHIRKYPNGLVTKLWTSISNARIEYLAALGGNRRARKTVYGFIMTYTLYYACVILSKTLARNYTLTSAD